MRSRRRSATKAASLSARSPSPSRAPASPEQLHEAGRIIAEALGGRRATSTWPRAGICRPAGGPARGLRVLHTGRDFMGENPVWAADAGLLFWLDILAPALRSLDLATQERDGSSCPI